jgi:hypothetical protein
VPKAPSKLFTGNNIPETLNAKNRWEVEYYWERIKHDDFDWERISGLLISLRSGMGQPGSSGLRDITDFISHPTRNQGLIFRHIDQGRPKIQSQVLRIGAPLPIAPTVHTLGQLIVHHRIAPVAEMKSVLQPREHALQLCVLSLLHFGETEVQGKCAMLKMCSNSGRIWMAAELPDGTRYPCLSTNLKSVQWIAVGANPIHLSANIRAARGSDGIKLRLVAVR